MYFFGQQTVCLNSGLFRPCKYVNPSLESSGLGSVCGLDFCFFFFFNASIFPQLV